MAAIDLFGCNDISMGGIKTMKLSTRDSSNNPLVFPLDIVLKTNDESIIMLSDNEGTKVITMGDDNMEYRTVLPLYASITEDETTAAEGRYYNQVLNFEVSQLNITSNNQLKAFLFTNSGEFAISNMVCFIEDMNDNLWICGYNQPMVLESFDLQTGVAGEDNKYVLSYTCKSYSKIRQYQLI